jgi:TonB family protein
VKRSVGNNKSKKKIITEELFDLSTLDKFAWHSGNSEERSHPVGEKIPNGIGLYDMTGNLTEWCSDTYGIDEYNYSKEKDPSGPKKSGSYKVVRGGTFQSKINSLRNSRRANDFESVYFDRSNAIVQGFRLVMMNGSANSGKSAALKDLAAEREVAAAVGRLKELAARPVELSSIRSAPGASGAAGSARATAEQLAYFRAIDDRIRANWIAPRGDTSSLMVQVVVTIERTGAVSSAVVEKGSGNDFFDDSVQRAIRKASPLPVPPERLRGGQESYSVGFRFYGPGGDGNL